MRRLKDDRMIQHDPTMYAHAEELVLGNVRFKALFRVKFLLYLSSVMVYKRLKQID